jgi:hypothetical protein
MTSMTQMYSHYHNVRPARAGLIQASEIGQFLARTARSIAVPASGQDGRLVF